MRACIRESKWVSSLTNTSWWLTAWAKEKEAWTSKGHPNAHVYAIQLLLCYTHCTYIIVIVVIITNLLPRELSQIATCCLFCTISWISSRPSPNSACFCAIRFRHDVNTSNDWATGDAGTPAEEEAEEEEEEHNTLVSKSFAGIHCML